VRADVSEVRIGGTRGGIPSGMIGLETYYWQPSLLSGTTATTTNYERSVEHARRDLAERVERARIEGKAEQAHVAALAEDARRSYKTAAILLGDPAWVARAEHYAREHRTTVEALAEAGIGAERWTAHHARALASADAGKRRSLALANERALDEIAARHRARRRWRWGLAAVAALGLGALALLSGCTVSPEYRAFVRASRGYANVVAPHARADISSTLSAQSRANRLGLLDDYEATLLAEEERVGSRVGSEGGR